MKLQQDKFQYFSLNKCDFSFANICYYLYLLFYIYITPRNLSLKIITDKNDYIDAISRIIIMTSFFFFLLIVLMHLLKSK